MDAVEYALLMDAVLAAPLRDPDDPIRALLTALEATFPAEAAEWDRAAALVSCHPE